jgi:hypothetical protein
MAELATTPVASNGSTVQALAAANAGGDTVARRDGAFLVVQNPTGGPITLTIDTPGTTHGLAIADEGVVVAAGTTHIVPIYDSVFVHPDDGLIHLAYSAAGLNVGAFSV